MFSSIKKASFGILFLLIRFPFGLLEDFTQEEVIARDLNCWTCNQNEEDTDGEGTGGVCTGDHEHEGNSVLCPPLDYPRDTDVRTLDSYKCWIMKVVSGDSNKIEIMKGCSSIAYDFIENADYQFAPIHPENGCSNITNGTFSLGEMRVHYQIRMCFCDTTDCNKKEIEGIGTEDIYLRNKMKPGIAPTLVNSFWMQLCGLVVTGVGLGIMSR